VAVARSGTSGAPKPSPAALAALRVARMSLGGGEGGHNVVNTAATAVVSPLGDATNSRPLSARGTMRRTSLKDVMSPAAARPFSSAT
jgi:hypothetical protein